ncbi:MAG: glycoside hydrolase family 88 protein [Clostridia bacterium]|nr:glycoside hydrolase family 88 protein [Clostridia bacterium]
MLSPLDYAKSACDTMMRRFAAADLPPKGHFHYHQGVFLSGMQQTYALCGNEAYFEYIKAWIDSVFDEDGRIRDCTFANLDDIQPGILLYPILDKTGDPYYLRCLRSVYEEVCAIPRNSLGGYWHKVHTVDQMWLDGLYMVGPFSCEYAQRFHLPELRQTIVNHALLMREKTQDKATGLYYHAWDGAGIMEWANPITGCSAEFWGRSMGWMPVALLNDLDFFSPDDPGYEDLAQMAVDLLLALCRYQSDDGRWYQVTNKGDQPGNWLENSCSCLYVAGLCKAMRRGFLSRDYLTNAQKGYQGVINSLTFIGEDIQIGHVCIGTGVGDYPFYCARPVSVNDLHGVGAFLIMCTEMQMLLDQIGE